MSCKELEKRVALRRERSAWRHATAGMLTLSLAWNVTAEIIYQQDRTSWQEENVRLREAVAQAENVRDHAVRELGTIAMKTAQEQQFRANQAAAYETLNEYQYIGECTITAYCCERYSHICGTGDGITATGIPVAPGIVAVDPEVIPIGSTVIIDGLSYLAADTGELIQGNRIDIAVSTHAEAEAFGTRTAVVWLKAVEAQK